MVDLVTLSVAILTFILVYLGKNVIGRKHKSLERPPCLFHLPIIGSLLSLPDVQKLHVFFLQKSKEIGNIFALYMSNRYSIVLNGKETIHEALVKHSMVFADRPLLYLLKTFKEDNIGIIFHQYNEHYKKFHHLSLNILKSFGFGQGIMESRIRVEVDNLLGRFFSKKGQSFDPNYELTASVSNVICSIIYGKRWEIDDPAFREGIDLLRLQLHDIEKLMLVNFFPFLRFLPALNTQINEQIQIRERMKKNITTVLSKISDHDAGPSFYKALMEEIDSNKSGKISEEDEDNLLLIIRDLFIGGTETTATTLLWFIIFMANNQSVQNQIREEIDQVVGKDRHPSLDDKPHLPKFEATLLELLRIRTLVPLALPHSTLKDVYLKGMFIPENTMVFVNLYSCHMDPDVWSDPEKFCIDRFLDETKSKVINKDLVVAFSLGKRSCFGEILARQELFLFASALVHEFEIHPAEDDTFIDETEVVTVTVKPKAFKARFIKRKI